jgi:formamidopyrimidine-DNA glycosylase
MGLGIGAGANVLMRPTPGTPREPPLEQQFKKHSRTAVPCSVCGKIIPAKQAKIRENKVYCEKCFKTNVEKRPGADKTDASSQHMIR